MSTCTIELPAPRLTTTDEVTQACANVEPVAPFARLVGNWVWVEFPTKPHAEVLTWLKQTGFRWNGERKAWQHSCGHFARRNRLIDPRKVYGQQQIDGDYCTREDAGTAPGATHQPDPRPTYAQQHTERFRDELRNFQAI